MDGDISSLYFMLILSVELLTWGISVSSLRTSSRSGLWQGVSPVSKLSIVSVETVPSHPLSVLSHWLS